MGVQHYGLPVEKFVLYWRWFHVEKLVLYWRSFFLHPEGGRGMEIGRSVSPPASRTPAEGASVCLNEVYKYSNSLFQRLCRRKNWYKVLTLSIFVCLNRFAFVCQRMYVTDKNVIFCTTHWIVNWAPERSPELDPHSWPSVNPRWRIGVVTHHSLFPVSTKIHCPVVFHSTSFSILIIVELALVLNIDEILPLGAK